MSEPLQPEWSPDEPVIKGILNHAEGVLRGARALLDAELPHLAYHLALLAFEEVGKLEVVLMGRVGTDEEEEIFRKKFIDDHVGKIFWAFWGPTFTSALADPKQIRWRQNLAKKFHEKRLLAIYAEPYTDGFISPADYVTPDEARFLIELAEARLGMQKEHKPGTLTDEEKADLVWFRAARYDHQNKTFIFGQTAMDKLDELGDIRSWMKWLRTTVEAEEAELLKLAQTEMARQIQPDDIDLPKWKVRIRIKTNSHLIKSKAVNKWNSHGTPFEWKYIQRQDQFTVDFTLPKSVKAGELYEAGLFFSYRFLVALNIGTHGFFWFDLPLQTAKFHEQILDLESKNYIEVGRNVVKRVNRKVEPIKDSEILWTMVAFGLLPHNPVDLYPFERYSQGLMFMAKTDIHSGFEVNAFGAFFDCFVSSMRMFADWDGNPATARSAAMNVLAPHITRVEETVEEIFGLAEAYRPGQPTPDVNIEQAAIMKLLADVYLCGALDREAIRRRGEVERPPHEERD